MLATNTQSVGAGFTTWPNRRLPRFDLDFQRGCADATQLRLNHYRSTVMRLVRLVSNHSVFP